MTLSIRNDLSPVREARDQGKLRESDYLVDGPLSSYCSLEG